MIFQMGVLLGGEAFYITAFPSMIWSVDPDIGHRVVNVWFFVMYLGQGLKDQLKVGV